MRANVPAKPKRRAGRKPPDPELVERALLARRRGVTQAEAAQLCGVVPATIREWERRYGYQPAEVPPPRVPDAPDLTDAVDSPEPVDSASMLDTLREAMSSMNAARKAYLRSGDARSATTAVNSLSKLAPLLARLEREASADADYVRIPRAAFAAAAASYRERVGKVLAQPLTCAKCGARLRASLAGVTLAGDEGEA